MEKVSAAEGKGPFFLLPPLWERSLEFLLIFSTAAISLSPRLETGIENEKVEALKMAADSYCRKMTKQKNVITGLSKASYSARIRTTFFCLAMKLFLT